MYFCRRCEKEVHDIDCEGLCKGCNPDAFIKPQKKYWVDYNISYIVKNEYGLMEIHYNNLSIMKSQRINVDLKDFFSYTKTNWSDIKVNEILADEKGETISGIIDYLKKFNI